MTHNYKGYSIVGDLSINDFWKEYMEKMAQKEKMREMIDEDLELNKQLFYAYLNHCYAIGSLSQDQQKLSNNVRNQFRGKARNALIDRLDDNIREALLLDKSFKRFLQTFAK